MFFLDINEFSKNPDDQLNNFGWVFNFILRGDHGPEVADSPVAPEVVTLLFADFVDSLSFIFSGIAKGHVDSDVGVLVDGEFFYDFLGFYEELFEDVIFGDEDDDGLGNFSVGDGVFGDFFEVLFKFNLSLKIESYILKGHNSDTFNKVFHGLFGFHHVFCGGSRFPQNIKGPVQPIHFDQDFLFFESLLVVVL
jgi:hypothetical protein